MLIVRAAELDLTFPIAIFPAFIGIFLLLSPLNPGPVVLWSTQGLSKDILSPTTKEVTDNVPLAEVIVPTDDPFL